MKNKSFWLITVCVLLIIVNIIGNNPLLRVALILNAGVLVWDVVDKIKRLRSH